MLKTNLLSAFCLVFTLPMTKAAAQIIPDDTLGTEKSIITPADELNDKIEGGASRGSNLFHSFSEFNVGEGRGVDFVNPAGIENILTRVTGNNVSNIFGRLGVLGEANLFLINPNGIIFGDGARLDMTGSFYGSTAESILFPDRVEFSAVNPEKTLLTIDRPLGLYLGNNPGTIVNRSFVQNSTGTDFVGLEVIPGETLSLVGGNINFEAGQVTAPGGRVELGGLSEVGIVTLNHDGSLTFPKDVERADITLRNAADVDVRSTGGGSIAINGRNVSLSAGNFGVSQIRAGITANSNSAEATSGDLIINATGDITVEQSFIFNDVQSNGVGNAGSVKINTTNLTLNNVGIISSSTFGRGDAGTITINADDNIFINGFASLITNTVQPNAVGNAGTVEINTTNLTLNNAGQIQSATLSQGNGGTIAINATDSILVSGQDSNGNFSLIASTTQLNGVGDAGTVKINTTNLTLNNGGRIQSDTFGQGDAGTITINAGDTISVSGNFSAIFSNVAPNAVGKAGAVKINTTNLNLDNGGQIGSSTFGRGDAGTITINADDTISVFGEDTRGFLSVIFSDVRPNATGNGGKIKINTKNLNLNNGGQIGSSTFGRGDAGTIIINADDTISVFGEDTRGFPSGMVTNYSKL